MKQSNYLCLVVAYYLSRYDKNAYNALGFGNRTETHRAVAKILEANANTLKNMRDEFDPLHDNKRAGWYQRELRPSRQKIVEAFQNLEEEELRDLVKEILENKKVIEPTNPVDLVEVIDQPSYDTNSIFIVRGITGRKAEEIYIEFHQQNALPIPGKIIDKRDHGCGYDFEINGESKVYIEVKGLDGKSGGISFTSKEWDVAKKERENYFLVLVKNISISPVIEIIQNPYETLEPKRYVFTTIQIRWNLTIA
jgi:hypothetical protein